MKEYKTTEESASYLGISKSTLYKYKSSGLIKSYKPNGKLLYFRKEDLDNFLNQGGSSTMEEELDRVNNTLNKN